MKLLIVFALVFATVLAEDFHSRSIHDPVLENEGRIVHGKNATPEHFKYQVGLYLRVHFLIRAWCGGSLISENWVLTAARCTDNVTSARVYLGATKRLDPEIVYNASKSDIIMHPDWNPRTSKNDIALIRIPTTHESSRIGIVRIPNQNVNKNIGDSVVVSGWGYRDDKTKTLSYNLQYVLLKVSRGSVCSDYYDEYYNDNEFICAATLNGMTPCRGDEGGPLALEGQNLQIGVMLYNDNDGCTKGGPTVFTRIGAYYPWINSHTGI